MNRLLFEVGVDDFWTKTRYVKVARVLDMKDVHNVKQADIVIALGVSNGLVTRYKQYSEEHPE